MSRVRVSCPSGRRQQKTLMLAAVAPYLASPSTSRAELARVWLETWSTPWEGRGPGR